MPREPQGEKKNQLSFLSSKQLEDRSGSRRSSSPLWVREEERLVTSGSRKLLYIVAQASRATRALVRRLVLPSCTAPPLAARSLFTRSPTNQRGRSGAWTRCAPGGENGCCAPPRRREEGATGLRSGFPPARRKLGASLTLRFNAG